jgi:hypothetical protein
MLQQEFEKGDPAHIFLQRQELERIAMREDDKFDSFLTRYESICNELARHECALTSSEKQYRLLMKLPASATPARNYVTVNHIVSYTQTVDYLRVYFSDREATRQMGKTAQRDDGKRQDGVDVLALGGRPNTVGGGQPAGKPKRYCRGCKMPVYHRESACWNLHRNLNQREPKRQADSGWRRRTPVQRPRPSRPSQTQGPDRSTGLSCYICRGQHLAKYCPVQRDTRFQRLVEEHREDGRGRLVGVVAGDREDERNRHGKRKRHKDDESDEDTRGGGGGGGSKKRKRDEDEDDSDTGGGGRPKQKKKKFFRD